MRLFIVGDYTSGTGPANVTKDLIEALPKDTLYLKYWNKVLRLCEIYIKMPFCDVSVISGHSKQNLWAIKAAKLFGKKCIFLMHGCVEHENNINGVPNEGMNFVERATLSGCDMILAVSKQFESWLLENYPQYSSKIAHLTNGINWESYPQTQPDKKNGKIISVGGGMPRKQIKKICQAIEILNRENMQLSLTVAGDEGADTEEINSYPFVDNLGLVSHDRMKQEFSESVLFIQNSSFETFGLAPIEAIACGCSILLSKEIGAWSVIKDENISDFDVIMNYSDENEIAKKIKNVLDNPNNERLLAGIDRADTSWKAVAKRLMDFSKVVKA